MRGVDAHTGKTLDGLDHLRQSIRDILTTRIGTRVQRRDYGSRLPELVDTPFSPNRAIEFYAATAEALDEWEPRIEVTQVKVASAPQDGAVIIDVIGIYRHDGQVFTLEGIQVDR